MPLKLNRKDADGAISFEEAGVRISDGKVRKPEFDIFPSNEYRVGYGVVRDVPIEITGKTKKVGVVTTFEVLYIFEKGGNRTLESEFVDKDAIRVDGTNIPVTENKNDWYLVPVHTLARLIAAEY